MEGYETFAIDENTIGVRTKWISIKEKLPQDHENVLVFDKTEGVCRGYTYLGSWSHWPLGSFAGDGCLFDVTHWAILPLPPQET